MKPLVKIGLLFISALLSTVLPAQKRTADSASANAFPAMYRQYMKGAGGAVLLYSGAEYEGAYPRVLGSPFWNNADFSSGSIAYGGVLYHNVLLAYDLVRNEVLMKGFQGLSQRLEKEKVDYFQLAGHTYIHLIDTLSKNSLPADYYELLYAGAVRAYAKRIKVITKAFSAESQDSITGRNAYFLFKDDTYYPVDDAKDLAKIFPSEKNSLKDFWKDRHLNFKKEPEVFIIQTIKHWEELKK